MAFVAFIFNVCNFSFVVFNLCLTNMCFSMFLTHVPTWIFPIWTLCSSQMLVTISLPMLGNFSAIISSNIFSDPFSLSFSSGNSLMQISVPLILSWTSLRLSLSFVMFRGSDFHYYLSVTYLFFCFTYSIDSFWCIFHFILFICLFLSSSRSSANIYCIFLNPCLHSFSEILDHLHYYSEFFFWQVGCLYFTQLFWVSSCSFTWDIFLFNLILTNFLGLP